MRIRLTTFFSFCLSLLLLVAFSAHAQITDSLLRQANDPVAGNPHGKITVVEFFDYRCSHCVNMAPIIDSILKSNQNIRIVFKEYPIRGEESEYAARAALAANKQGKYYRFSHALLTSKGHLNADAVLTIADKLGINTKQLEKDMKSPSVEAQLSANSRLAETLQLYGTPAFFVGKTNAKDMKELGFYYGELSQRELQAAINKAAR